MRAIGKLLSCVLAGIVILGAAGTQAQTNLSYPGGSTYGGNAILADINTRHGLDRWDAIYDVTGEGSGSVVVWHETGRVGNQINFAGHCWNSSGVPIDASGWMTPTQQYLYYYYIHNDPGQAPQNAYGNNPWPPTITNVGGVANLTANSATFNGWLESTGSAATAVSVYWGATDRGQTTAGWDAVVNLGTCTQGQYVSTSVSGLSQSTTYYYRFYATNSAGCSWSDPAAQFKPASSPAINNGTGATGVQSGSATLTGNLTAGGNASVTVYWGNTDSGTTAGSWQHSTSPGALNQGAFSCAISGLGQGATYYYRCYAANSVGTGWAGATTSFQTLPALPLGWSARMKIAFSGYNPAHGGTETLTNFPALIVLNQNTYGFLYSQFQTAGGGDLRFTDANYTEIPYEIDTWNPSGNSYVWVNVPAIANSSSYIWACWDLTGATAPAYTTNGATWTNCAAVWHMNQANALDSSGNGNNGSVSGTVTTVTSSLSGGADQFGGSGYICVPESLTTREHTNGLTVSFWLQNDLGGYTVSRIGYVPFAASVSPLAVPSTGFYESGSWLIGQGGAPAGVGYIGVGSGRSDPSSAWHQYALVYDGVNQPVSWSAFTRPYGLMHAYKDGVWIGDDAGNSGYPTAAINACYGDAESLCLGAKNLDFSQKLNATMDEVRMENAVRSVNWMWANYMTMASNSVFTTYTMASTGDTTPPAAPSGLTATPVSSSQINLSWTDNATNEINFKIERKTGAGGTWAQIGAVGPNVTVYSDTGLAGSTLYYYRVRASNFAGDSAYSGEANATTLVPTAPNAPSGLTATAAGYTQINLAWADNSNNEDTFKIERKTGAGGTYAQIAVVGTNVTAYSDTGLTPGTTYYYRVRAGNGVGDSGYSNEGNATTQALPAIPAAPSGLTATAASGSQINLSWTDNATNETQFMIERKTGAGGTYGQIATAGANVTTYSDSGLSPSTTYYYRVRATNLGGNSGYSNEANTTTPASSALTINFCGGSYSSPYTVPSGSFSGSISLDAGSGGDILNEQNSTTVTASQVSIGQSDSTGTEIYNLSGGSLNAAGNVYLAAHGGACASTLAISGSGVFTTTLDFYFGDWSGGAESGTLDISGNGVFNQTGGQLQLGKSNSYIRVTGGGASITAIYYRTDGHSIGGLTFTLTSGGSNISPLVATAGDFDLSGSSGKIHVTTSGFSPTVGQTFDLIKVPQNCRLLVPATGTNTLLNSGDTANWSLSVVSAVGGYNVLRATALTGGGPSSTTVHGIPYSWLTDHGITNTSDSIETACLNGNGLDVLQDYIAGMDPTNRNSCFSVVITNMAGQIVICVPSIQATGSDYLNKTRYYDVEQCTNLLTGGSWQPAPGYSGGVPANSGVIACTNATPGSVTFYRARVWLQ